MTTLHCKNILLRNPEKWKPETHLAEYSKEDCGSKRAPFPMMMMMMMMVVVIFQICSVSESRDMYDDFALNCFYFRQGLTDGASRKLKSNLVMRLG
jgi:hypothetical protein